jgi:hypothetical protein
MIESKPELSGEQINSLESISTEPSGLNASEFQPLPERFTDDGYNLTVRRRQCNVALISKSKPDHATSSYEVVLVRTLPASVIFGKPFPRREAMPTNEDWGTSGWTYATFEQAEKKFLQLAEANATYSPGRRAPKSRPVAAEPPAPKADAGSDFRTVGNRVLSAWGVGDAVWVQTRCPEIAQKLSWLTRNPRPRLVMWGVAGGYLRTYELSKPMAWVEAWITEVLSARETRKSREDLSTKSKGRKCRVPVGATLIPAGGDDSGEGVRR